MSMLLNYIQRLLCHLGLLTTEVYTHVSVDQLKQVHNAYAPAKVDHYNSSSFNLLIISNGNIICQVYAGCVYLVDESRIC